MTATPESPVSVSDSRVHLREARMEIGKFYLIEYKKRTLAIRKLHNTKIEVYGLPR